MNTKHLYTLIITLFTMMLGVNGFATTMGDGEEPYLYWKHVNCNVGEDCIGLRWERAYDDKTPQKRLKYKVSWIATDGNIGVYEEYDKISYIIKGLSADAKVLIYVSVVDEDGNRTYYDDVITQTKAGYLPIGIGGVQVTTSNMNDVLGDGGSVMVVKEDDQYTVKLNNATITSSSFYGIWAACNLKISPNGDCKVTSDYEGIWVAGNCEIRGDGYIVFKGGIQGGAANCFGGDLLLRRAVCTFQTTKTDEYAVDMNNNRLDIVCSKSIFIGGCGAITNIGNFQTLGCKDHSDWQYNSVQHKIVSTTADKAERILVSTEPASDEKIGIRIAGVEVTYANCFDVLGDEKGEYGLGSVYIEWDNPYLPKQPTIVLDNANIIGNESENSFDKIIDCYSSLLQKVSIQLYGENNISKGGIYAMTYLYILGPGSLTVSNAKWPLYTLSNVYLEDLCSVNLYGKNCAAYLIGGSTFKVTNSSLTMTSAPDCDFVFGSNFAMKLEKSYIASNHSLQQKDGRAVICNPDGSIAQGGPVVIKAGTKPTNKYDVNQDGSVNGADIVAIYNYIQAGTTSGITSQRADVNSDNAVNGADAVAVYNYIVSGQK